MGSLQDMYGFKKTHIAMMVLQWFISLTIYYTRFSEILYTIWVCCTFFCLGGHFSCFPSAIVTIFGITNGGMIATIASVLVVPASAMASFVLVKSGAEPFMIFIVGTAFSTVNLCILSNFDDSPMVRKSHKSL